MSKVDLQRIRVTGFKRGHTTESFYKKFRRGIGGMFSPRG